MAVSPIPKVEGTDDGAYRISVEATYRPNLVQVVRVGGRLVTSNGVHRALALVSRGTESIPCVIRSVGAWEQVGFPEQMFEMFRAPVLSSARPAIVEDFLDDHVAAALQMAGTSRILRVAIGVEEILAPFPD